MTEDDYKAEIARLTRERDELFIENGKIANTVGADNLRLRAAMERAADMLPANAACGVLRAALNQHTK